MWKLRKLGRIKPLGIVAGLVSKIVFYKGRVLSIKRGPLKGLKWYCHPQHQFWMPLGLYEKETTDWLLSRMNSRTVFYDIGANAGYFTLVGAKYAKKTYAFEPVPINVEVISKHIDYNEIGNTIIEQVAINDKKGLTNFTIEKKNANSHLAQLPISHASTSTVEVIEVEAITLDDYVRENDPPTLVKVDVEGAEMSVLHGAKNCLTTFYPDIIVSTHSSQLYTDCNRFLVECGYKVSSLSGFDHELIGRRISSETN
ncbi:MAG: FkbM family methyltransferase [Saprospiraceae bacterium]|nr:FkbM family methyltransferase [Saprospiraceae bacterium]